MQWGSVQYRSYSPQHELTGNVQSLSKHLCNSRGRLCCWGGGVVCSCVIRCLLKHEEMCDYVVSWLTVCLLCVMRDVSPFCSLECPRQISPMGDNKGLSYLILSYLCLLGITDQQHRPTTQTNNSGKNTEMKRAEFKLRTVS